MPHLSRTRAGIATAAATLGCAVPAAAQAPLPGPTPPTRITVVGIGIVKPTPVDRNSNASIAEAVRAAKAAATPRALADGQARAAALAAQAHVELGALLEIAERTSSPFGFFGPSFGGQEGTFGPGRFCGTVRRPIYRTTAGGKRKRVGFRSRRTCRVPAQVTTSLEMTFGRF